MQSVVHGLGEGIMRGQGLTFHHAHSNVHSHVVYHFGGYVQIVSVVMGRVWHHGGTTRIRLMMVVMVHLLLKLLLHHLPENI